MGISTSSGLTSVTGSVTVDPTANQTILKATGTCANVQTTDIFTVTAGKVAYIVGFTMSFNNGAGGANLTLKDSDGNVFTKGYVAVNTGNMVSMSFAPGREPSLAASKKMQVQSDGVSATGIAVVYYYEVAA